MRGLGLDPGFLKGLDERTRGLLRPYLTRVNCEVVEVGTGADAGKVKVRRPGEITATADLPFSPVVGSTPVVGDRVWVFANFAGRLVITGGGGGGGTHGSTHTSTGSDPVPNAVANGAAGLMAGADKAKLDGLTPTDWTSIPDSSLLNNWVVYSEGERPRYSRIGEQVFVEGVLKKSSTPTAYETIFSLPAGFRPGKTIANPVNANTAFGLIQVLATGELRYVSGGASTVFYTFISFRRA